MSAKKYIQLFVCLRFNLVNKFDLLGAFNELNYLCKVK